MFKVAATGLAIFVVGAIKLALHLGRTPTLEDYLAFRCASPEASESLLFPGALLSLAHCWGCYAMAAGAALMAWAAVTNFASARQRAGGGR